MWWLIGYLVSIPLAYCGFKANMRAEFPDLPWRRSDRSMGIVLALSGPIALFIGCVKFLNRRINVDWNKEVRW